MAIRSKANNKAYSSNYDKVFGKKPKQKIVKDCERCHGSGREVIITDDHGHYGYSVDCGICKGTGKISK